ncbi:MAG: NADH-quinone oxidoreductase subunit H, partial [Candidatus Marinimicrobia bacterium]|nr:NADH-quinone oxidoreductase subunit H [Candidatus Neomarinimicrobiota bacterium]
MLSFDILASLVKVVVVFSAVMLAIMVMILAERRVSAFMQYRLGPNRVGPGGILQPVADGLKFLFKEDIIPSHANRPIYLLAPVITMIPALMTFA